MQTAIHRQRTGWITALAVALYVLCLVPLFVAGSVGVVLMFALIAAATALLILNRTNVHPVRASLSAAAVALFIMSPMANVIFSNVLGVIMMFVMIGVGVGLVVYGQTEQFQWKPDAEDATRGTAEADARLAGEARTRRIAVIAILAGLLVLVMLSVVFDHNRNVSVYGMDGELIVGGAEAPDSIIITDGDEAALEDVIEERIEAAFEGKHGDGNDAHQDGDKKSGKSGKSDPAVAASVGSFTVSLADVRKIEIDWVGGSVELVNYDGAEITMTEASAKQLSDAQKLRYWIKNDTLHVSYCEDTLSKWTGLDLAAFNMPEKTLIVQLPAGAEAQIEELEINSVSAEVSATDLAANQLDITSISGGIRLTNVLADKIDLESTSGSVDAQEISTNKLDVETISGEANVNRSFVKSLEFSGTSGSGQFFLTVAPDKIESETVSGDCVIVLPADATDFAIRLETVSGKVRCDFASTQQSGAYIVGAGGSVYEFESVSGDVRILSG